MSVITAHTRPATSRAYCRLRPADRGPTSRQRGIESRVVDPSMCQQVAAIKSHRLEAPARCSAQSERKERKRCASMLLTDVGKYLLVVPARVFLLSFSKWYVVSDAANSSIGLG